MFESVAPDPAATARRRVTMIFRVVAAMIVLVTAFLTITAPRLDRFAINGFLACAAWLIAEGLDDGKRWATWAAILYAIAELFSVPFGTAVGIASLVYLNRLRAAPAETLADSK